MNKLFGIILVFFIIFSFLLSGYYIYEVISHPIKYETEIINISKKYNIDAPLIASLINVESSYRSYVKSNKNAIGLTQIKLSTANYLNELDNKQIIEEQDLYLPSTNIEYGAKYFSYLLKKFPNQNVALAAYNAGETRVRSCLNNGIYSKDGKSLFYIPFEETRNYVEKINKNIKFYNKIYK